MYILIEFKVIMLSSAVHMCALYKHLQYLDVLLCMCMCIGETFYFKIVLGYYGSQHDMKN
jgi:hypothetical protein